MEDNENILHGPKESIKPFKNLTLGQLLLNQLIIHGQRVAQVNAYTGEEQTFQQIADDSRQLAVYLQTTGLSTGDRIAVCSENNLEFCIPVCAAFFLGATVCPLNPMYTEKELTHGLNISKPKYIFASTIAMGTVGKIINQLSWSPKVIVLNDTANDTDSPDFLTMKSLISNVDKATARTLQPRKVNTKDHVAAILCSSGTTGLAKGVMLTDKNILTVIGQIADSAINFLEKDAVTLNLLPYFHSYSFGIMIVKLIGGSKSIVLSRFNEKVFLRTIEKYKIERITVVPPLMVFLAKHPLVDRYDLSSLKTIWCGAAPLSQELQQAVAKRLNISDINQGYGLTETTLAVLRSPEVNKFGSVGVLAPGVSAKVIPIEEDGSGKPLGPNCIGELCFKGDLIMKGYYGDSASTSKTIDEHGWLHTGDIGYYDEDGYFFIVDRLKELIKYKGYQVPPAELEAILLTYPGIKDAAVVGLPNEEAGELPLAFVVKQDGSNVNAEQIIKYVNERVSNNKRLRGGVRFIDNIPKTASGKILRRALREMLKSKL